MAMLFSTVGRTAAVRLKIGGAALSRIMYDDVQLYIPSRLIKVKPTLVKDVGEVARMGGPVKV